MSRHANSTDVIKSPNRPVYDVAQYCRQQGLPSEVRRRMVALLGAYASRHELETNVTPRRQKFR
jgi:hypothetical protein